MSRVHLGIWSCMLMAAGLATGCTERPGEEREAPMPLGDQGGPEDVGSSAEALEGTYCIINARVASGSFHFDGPRWLLNSAEGYGPQTLTVTIHHVVYPQITTTLKPSPSVNDITTAVGYSLLDGVHLVAASTVKVEEGKFMRLEAYAAFQKTVWDIRDANCNAYLGSGSTFKPIGVYFETRNVMNIAVPDVGIYTVTPDCPGGICAGPGGAGDAGAGDAGAGEAGAAEAGASDGGTDAAGGAGDAAVGGAKDGGL